ncbi:pseudouridine synthase [candidate division KSB3 bacterium]|uniref:Pseudouridine synthase n=1 Tax=candidate division KSB3 bacterium TaxID=2044937 RepID=A0A2G6E5U2_9BACT|nr:MAG: pseudouridine synthase [candidate division KSB3 bacterium]PIE29868.1 MAG: pseudouridine synthase [candidate division KSB3 bacterium]
MSGFSRAPRPSYATLPDCAPPYPTILDFLDKRFPKLGRDVWQARLDQGKIRDDRGQLIDLDTPYQPALRLCYFREVDKEPSIPFREKILYQDERILIADKPHFLPVTPAGPYVNECLLYRLRADTGLQEIVPVHRIDRETAGLVMFSIDRRTRGLYHELFSAGHARKCYEAIATLPAEQDRETWLIKNRIVAGEPWFRVKVAEGEVNAISKITVMQRKGSIGRFRLEPLTGKQHQLRLHLSLIGSQILNDRYYPHLQPKHADDFEHPLQLLAQELCFRDPVANKMREFQSTQSLEFP